MPVTSYSTTPSSNNSAPPNGAPESMAAGSLNDVIRQVMSDIAVEAQINQVKVLSSVAGTDTITGSMSPALTTYTSRGGMHVIFTPANDNTGAATLNVNSLGALDLFKYNGESLAAKDLKSGIPAVCYLDSGADDFLLLNPQSGLQTTPNLSASEIGYKGLPQNTQSSSYGLVLTDAGKEIYYTGASGTITIPANASVAFPIGTAISIFAAGGSITIAITSDTLLWVGPGSTGSRTLTQYGECVIKKYASTNWRISGTSLS